MIPVKSAIEEQAWLLIDNSDYTNDGHMGDEIRKVKFRFKPLGLTKIDPASIDGQENIRSVILSENLYLLRMELISLSKEPFQGYPRSIFHKYIVMRDSEGFTFKPIYDDHLCAFSDFARQSEQHNFNLTTTFNPKINYKATILFELPDEVDDLFFASTYSEIREA